MPKIKINWAAVSDDAFRTHSDSDLARQLRCSHQNVGLQRQRRGLPPFRQRGRLPGDGAGLPRQRATPAAAQLTPDALRHLATLAGGAGLTPSEFILQIGNSEG